MFEKIKQRVAPPHVYQQRVWRSVRVTTAMLVVSLGMGMLGYRIFGQLGWVDAFLNASMILTGMGPVDPMPSPAGKIFAGLYAIFSGVAFLTGIAVIAAPIVHRFLHTLHVDIDD